MKIKLGGEQQQAPMNPNSAEFNPQEAGVFLRNGSRGECEYGKKVLHRL